jgi:hypothetical protein
MFHGVLIPGSCASWANDTNPATIIVTGIGGIREVELPVRVARMPQIH